MSYNFDEIIPRNGTRSVKFGLRKAKFGRADLLPMWVADMDFRTPRFITDAVKKRAAHEIYGYTYRPKEYNESIVHWIKEQHSWNIEKEWIIFCPGVVPALNLAIMAYTNPGDKVIVQPPVYFPFFSAVKNNNRKLVNNQLLYKDGKYTIDFKNLEKEAANGAKLILLSNPHNPVGRVWTEKELEKLAGICINHDILIISDEIHSDLILPGNKHIPTAGISETIANQVVTCMAPSKSFNIAGLATSSVIISNPVIREKFNMMMERLHIGGGNIFGMEASIAAYSNGKEWIDKMLEYVNDNMVLVYNYCQERIPLIKPVKAEATYLMWLDCIDLEMDDVSLHKFMIEKAGLGFNDGPTFGIGGNGFQRINVACPRSVVQEALERLEKAMKIIKS